MKNIKRVFIALAIFLYHVVASQNTTPSELTKCISNLIEKLFSNDNPIYFIFEDQKIDSVPFHINNPRVIVNMENPIRKSYNFYYNHVIFSNGPNSLIGTFEKLRNSPIWSVSDSPRGKFLIITSSRSSFNNIFQVLWSYGIINVMVVSYDEETPPIVYTSNLFLMGNKCGKEAKIIFAQNCDDVSIMGGFNKTIKSLNGCSLKVLKGVAEASFKTVANRAILYYVVVAVAEILNGWAEAVPDQTNITTSSIHDRLLLIAVTRSIEVLNMYDLSEILYRDHFVWALPRSDKLYGFRMIAKIYKRDVWISIGLSVLVMVSIWWFMAKQANDRMEFQKFLRSFFTILSIYFCGGDNLKPKTNAMKFLALFYSLYCILINTSFNANLISALTKPIYDEGITTIDQLSESGLALMLQGSIRQINFSAAYGEHLYNKLQKHFVFSSSVSQYGVVMETILHRNVSALMSTMSLKIAEMYAGSELDALNAKLMSMEMTFYMKKGHYFMPTFNKLIIDLYELGLYHKIVGEAGMLMNDKSDNTISALGIRHLSSNFIFWGVGMLFATAVFIYEFLSNPKVDKINKITNAYAFRTASGFEEELKGQNQTKGE